MGIVEPGTTESERLLEKRGIGLGGFRNPESIKSCDLQVTSIQSAGTWAENSFLPSFGPGNVGGVSRLQQKNFWPR